MSDERLRRELIALGFTPGPITDSTRGILEKKLKKLRAESRSAPIKGPRLSGGYPRNSKPEYSDGREEEERWEARRSSWQPRHLRDERPSYSRVTPPNAWAAETPADLPYTRRSSPAQYTWDSCLPRTSLPEVESFPRVSAEYNRSSEAELRTRLSEDARLSSLPANPQPFRSRFQYQQPPLQNKWAPVDRGSYETTPLLKHEQSGYHKPTWSRTLEYYLTRLFRALSVVLVIVFIVILTIKSGLLHTHQEDSIKLLSSECEGREDPVCKVKQKQIVYQILSELYDFLSLEAGSFECGNPYGLGSKCVPINIAKEHVMNVTGHKPDKFDDALDWMLSSNKHFGIWAKGYDAEETVTAKDNIFCLESSRPSLGVYCRLKNALYTAVSNLFLALLGVLMLWLVLIYLRYHWKKLEKEEKQMFQMVEKIIDVVKIHYKDWTLGLEQNPYVGILHVRDTLITPPNRKSLKKVWDSAVQFIENNESRLRTESQRVAGADLRVWRWTHTRNEFPRGRVLSSTLISSTMNTE